MTFNQPLLLLALPLIALPILIHLINQNRHRTVHWAATMFLLQARKMATGMARLRYILILIARMLALAGLIFAVSRPLAGGWLALTAGGTPDTTLIILDRSASMEQTDPVSGRSKRGTAIEKLARLLTESGGSTHLVLIDSVTGTATPLEAAANLLDSPLTADSATAADLPSLLQSAADYIVSNQTGRTDIWICSDLQASDWNADSGRWDAIRSMFSDLQGVRFQLLTYTEPAADNLAVSVKNVHRRASADAAELVMDIRITRSSPVDRPMSIPVTLVINGTRTTMDLELSGDTLQLNGHVSVIDRNAVSGWGKIELPQDDNPTDNVFTFVYAEPSVHRTAIVADDPVLAEPFRLAASTPQQRGQNCEAVVFTPAQAAQLPWDQIALLIWIADFPDESLARSMQQFIASGRSILFVAPSTASSRSFAGFRWGSWNTASEGQHFFLSQWRPDSDLLANARSGSPLPVNRLEVFQYCPLDYASTVASSAPGVDSPGVDSPGVELPAKDFVRSVLAQLDGGIPLLTRVTIGDGTAYFLGTLPAEGYSNLLNQGVVFYIMLQRALAQGAAILGGAGSRSCGTVTDDQILQWTPLDAEAAALPPSRRSLVPGCYQTRTGQVALNRPAGEDTPASITDDELQQLFGALDYVRIQDQTSTQSSLASEIWRLFLGLMILGLLAEAILCVPQSVRTSAT